MERRYLKAKIDHYKAKEAYDRVSLDTGKNIEGEDNATQDSQKNSL